MNKLLIIGAGGQGKMVSNLAEQSGEWDTINFLDNNISGTVNGKRIIGTVDDLLLNPDYYYLVAIGDNLTRKNLYDQIIKLGYKLATIISSMATIDASVQIGKGTVIMPRAIINMNATIGLGSIINTGAIIEHDCKVGDFVHLSPGTVICGSVDLGNEVWIGANATVINNIKVCSKAVIGAGATVINNILIPGTYVGAPARLI